MCLSKLYGNYPGLLPQRQWPAGSQHQLDVRFHQLRWRAHRPGYSRSSWTSDRTNQFKLFGNYHMEGIHVWAPVGRPLRALRSPICWITRHTRTRAKSRSAPMRAVRSPFRPPLRRRRSPAREDLVALSAAPPGFSPSMCMASTP